MSARSPNRRNSRARRISLLVPIVLCVAGLVDTAYLSYLHARGGAGCSEHLGCSSVLQSRFSTLGGIPLAWLGLAFYAAMLVGHLALLSTTASSIRARLTSMTRIAAWIGVAVSAVLVFVQG